MTTAISRRTFSAGALAAAAGLALAACGSDSSSESGDGAVGGITVDGDVTTISVGCSPVPHAEILQFVQDNLAADAGLNLDIVEFTDYVLPNTSLEEGSLAANYFQTPGYLAQQIADNGFEFVSIADVHVEPMGLYSNSVTAVDDIPEGGKIALPNDASNAARALQVLVQAGLIELDPDVELADETSITSNPKNLEFTLVEAAQLARSLDDVDAAVINGNYAIEAGKVPSEDALVLEAGEGNPNSNELVVRTADKDNEALVTLAGLLTSDEVKAFIEENWSDGSVIAAF